MLKNIRQRKLTNETAKAVEQGIELKDPISKVQIDQEGDIVIEDKVSKLRSKVITDDIIMKEFEEKRKHMRKLLQQRNMQQLAAMTKTNGPAIKDADGNIIESGLLEILESKGAQVTFDY